MSQQGPLCAGVGLPPAEVIRPDRPPGAVLHGRGTCPACGRIVMFTSAFGMGRHVARREAEHVLAVRIPEGLRQAIESRAFLRKQTTSQVARDILEAHFEKYLDANRTTAAVDG